MPTCRLSRPVSVREVLGPPLSTTALFLGFLDPAWNRQLWDVEPTSSMPEDDRDSPPATGAFQETERRTRHRGNNSKPSSGAVIPESCRVESPTLLQFWKSPSRHPPPPSGGDRHLIRTVKDPVSAAGATTWYGSHRRIGNVWGLPSLPFQSFIPGPILLPCTNVEVCPMSRDLFLFLREPRKPPGA
jgi:hypothetical protein